jgi:HTH-type transcriptional repressor of NAD biosynthesis genes
MEDDRPLAWYGSGSSGYDYPDTPAATADPTPVAPKPAPPPDFGRYEGLRGGHGLVLGRFLPPHAGHAFLLDFARAQVDTLTVLVRASADDAIPVALRESWLAELAPGAAIHRLDAPFSTPLDAPDYWSRWAALVKPLAVGVTHLFASDPRAWRLASELRVAFVPLDPTREVIATSGTAIRANPLASWDVLPAPVRAHYARRVVLLGAEGSGKSTLARRLAARYRTRCVDEYARLAIDWRGGRFEPRDLLAVARGQAAAEDALARQANRVLICDTDLVQTILWAERLWGTCPDWLKTASDARVPHLTLVCDEPDAWTGDAARNKPAERQEFLASIQRVLGERNRRFELLTGSWDARFERACDAIDGLLA